MADFEKIMDRRSLICFLSLPFSLLGFALKYEA